MGLGFAAAKVDVFGKGEVLGGTCGEQTILGIAGVEGEEGFDGELKAVAALVARFGKARADFGEGLAGIEVAGDFFLFGRGEWIEGFLASEFHRVLVC